MTALTAALTTGGASGAARTAPVRRLRPCSKARGTETGWRALPARRRWLLLDVDGRARDGGPAAALGAISRRQLLFALARGNTDRWRSDADALVPRGHHKPAGREAFRGTRRLRMPTVSRSTYCLHPSPATVRGSAGD